MDNIDLNSLTVSQLKEQARILGIEIKGSPTASQLREKILAVLNDGDVTDLEEPAIAQTNSDWVTIVVAEDEKDQQPAYVGVNAKSYRIRRGEPVSVPPEVVEVLRNAKQRIPQKDGTYKNVPTYPFSIVG